MRHGGIILAYAATLSTSQSACWERYTIVRQEVTRAEKLIASIDEAMAHRFSSNRAKVYITGRRVEVFEKTAHELHANAGLRGRVIP